MAKINPNDDCVTCGSSKAKLVDINVDVNSLLARPLDGFTPAVYRFRQNEEVHGEQKLFEAADINLLLAQIIQYRSENKLPDIAYLKEVILDFTMRSEPAYEPYIQYYQTSEEVHVSAKQFLLGALAFMKAKTIKNQEDLFVPQAKAEKRALTCLNCPRHLVQVNGYTVDTPSLIQSRFMQLAGDRKTSVDGALKLCGVCTCLTKAKVHFTLDFIKSASTPQLMQSFKQKYMGLDGHPHVCWIGQEIEEAKT